MHTAGPDTAPPDADRPANHDENTVDNPDPADTGFRVRLRNFEGPFDLLLSLISQRRLDVTEVALHEVTDEFIAYTRRLGPELGLDRTTEFLVVAATLLDLKAARLLPSGDVDDPEDLALLEARDLLFARLLQYRAYKQVSAVIADRLATEGRRFPRIVQLEPHLAAMLPELVWKLGPDQLAALAARAMEPKPPPPGVSLTHLHAPAVSVREQAGIVVGLLRRQGAASFRALVADAGETIVVVARFLALLELFREGLVAFEQVEALGELTVRWTGTDRQAGALDGVGGEFDEGDAPAEPAPAAGSEPGTSP